MTSLAPSSFTDTSVQCGNAAVAGIVGLTVLLWGERLRLWQFHLMVLTATLQITVSVYESANPSVAVSFATLYVFIVHVFLILALANIPALQLGNIWLNTGAYVVVMALVWIMVKTRFLFRFIPR